MPDIWVPPTSAEEDCSPCPTCNPGQGYQSGDFSALLDANPNSWLPLCVEDGEVVSSCAIYASFYFDPAIYATKLRTTATMDNVMYGHPTGSIGIYWENDGYGGWSGGFPDGEYLIDDGNAHWVHKVNVQLGGWSLIDPWGSLGEVKHNGLDLCELPPPNKAEYYYRRNAKRRSN